MLARVSIKRIIYLRKDKMRKGGGLHLAGLRACAGGVPALGRGIGFGFWSLGFLISAYCFESREAVPEGKSQAAACHDDVRKAPMVTSPGPFQPYNSAQPRTSNQTVFALLTQESNLWRRGPRPHTNHEHSCSSTMSMPKITGRMLRRSLLRPSVGRRQRWHWRRNLPHPLMAALRRPGMKESLSGFCAPVQATCWT